MRMAVILVPERRSSRLHHLAACAARWMWEGGESGVHSQCVARGSGVHMVTGRGLGRRERGEAGGHLVYLTFRVGPWIKHSSTTSASFHLNGRPGTSTEPPLMPTQPPSGP